MSGTVLVHRVEYYYNPDGTRQKKMIVDDYSVRYTYHVWNGYNIVMETMTDPDWTSPDDVQWDKYYRGIHLISNGSDYFIYDDLGNILALNYTVNAINTSQVYTAFGVTDDRVVDAPFGYRGEYYDEETGFIYLRNRYYDPSNGRFITEDPIKDGLNWYVYCSNNPLKYVDPWGLESYIFVAAGMEDQAEIRKKFYTDKYGTDSYVVEVSSADDFISKWNTIFDICNEDGTTIDAIEIISHGSAAGNLGKDSSGKAYATGCMIFGSSRVYARDFRGLEGDDRSLNSIHFIAANEINVNACNSANPDIYNIVWGFMQRTDANVYTGFDGGAKWDSNVGDHVRGDGEYGRTLKHLFNPAYYVEKYQYTWWKYVDKNSDGSPARARVGRRVFYM